MRATTLASRALALACHATTLTRCAPGQGARLVRASGLPAVFVFLAPPSEKVLEQRLRARGTEGDAQIAERMVTAKEELARWAILARLSAG